MAKRQSPPARQSNRSLLLPDDDPNVQEGIMKGPTYKQMLNIPNSGSPSDTLRTPQDVAKFVGNKISNAIKNRTKPKSFIKVR